MTCAPATVEVYNGTDNLVSVLLGRLSLGVVAVANLTTATRITLRLYDADDTLAYTVDSDLSPAAITWAAAPASGQVDLKLGGEDIAVGAYNAKLTVYSPATPGGELFAPAGSGGYTLRVVVSDG